MKTEPGQLRRSAEYCGRYPERRWATILKSRHGIDSDTYYAQLVYQNYVCGICLRPPNSYQKLHVDHDHACCSGTRACGKCFRGLLCGNCNRALGLLKDEPQWLENARDYLIYGPSCTEQSRASRSKQSSS